MFWSFALLECDVEEVCRIIIVHCQYDDVIPTSFIDRPTILDLFFCFVLEIRNLSYIEFEKTNTNLIFTSLPVRRRQNSQSSTVFLISPHTQSLFFACHVRQLQSMPMPHSAQPTLPDQPISLLLYPSSCLSNQKPQSGDIEMFDAETYTEFAHATAYTHGGDGLYLLLVLLLVFKRKRFSKFLLKQTKYSNTKHQTNDRRSSVCKCQV